jgi:membrane-bound lytic murein transglycosylase D
MNIHCDPITPVSRAIGPCGKHLPLWYVRITLLLLAVVLMTSCAGLPDSRTAVPAGRVASLALGQQPAMRPITRQRPGDVYTPDKPEVQIDLASLPDLWSRMRAGFALPELDSPDVERFAERFAAMNWLEKLGPRARRYLYLLLIEAEKRGMPTELALLPIIESGLNPLAQSPAAAAGLCQFIPATGRIFGLHQSALTDRRKDLACISGMYAYLNQSAQLFNGDWILALASYNWGPGAVSRAIERNARSGQPVDYLSLRMPNETRAYVPQLLALKKLIMAPERYGVRLPAVANRPTIDCNVAIRRDIDVAMAARLATISEKDFRQLNAGVTREVIPRATHPHICLPLESVARFTANLREYKGRLATLTTHTALRRTTIATLAKHYGTTPEAIRSANDIAPGMRLKAGATILVPKTKGEGDISASVATTARILVEPDVPDIRRVVIRSKHHDNLSSIAKRYKVDPAALARWNPSARNPLKNGQKLVLNIPVNTPEGRN